MSELTDDTHTTTAPALPIPRVIVRVPATREATAFVQWMVRNGAPLFAPDEIPPGAENSTVYRVRAPDEAEAAPKRRPRKPTLIGVAKQANKTAIPVARYEVKPDGTVVVVTGAPEPAAAENPWLADLRKDSKQ